MKRAHLSQMLSLNFTEDNTYPFEQESVRECWRVCTLAYPTRSAHYNLLKNIWHPSESNKLLGELSAFNFVRFHDKRLELDNGNARRLTDKPQISEVVPSVHGRRNIMYIKYTTLCDSFSRDSQNRQRWMRSWSVSESRTLAWLGYFVCAPNQSGHSGADIRNRIVRTKKEANWHRIKVQTACIPHPTSRKRLGAACSPFVHTPVSVCFAFDQVAKPASESVKITLFLLTSVRQSSAMHTWSALSSWIGKSRISQGEGG